MAAIEPFGLCDFDSDCGPGYRCEGGICVPDSGGGPGGDPINPLPGLAAFLTKRFTSNVAITEQMPCLDLLYDVLFVANRGYIRQSQSGRLGMKIKKPVPYGFATSAVTGGDTSIDLDNVQDWIDTSDTYLLIAPHTSKSEVRVVSEANYSTGQNSKTISTTGGLFSHVSFSGCDGADTPATGSITVTTATGATDCTITVDGKTFAFTTSDSDTTDSLAAYIAGLIRAHPALNRKYEVVYTVGDSVVNLTARFGTLTLGAVTNTHNAPLVDPTTAPTLTASGSGSTLLAGTFAVAYSAVNNEGETLLSQYKTITLTAGQNLVVSTISLPTGATALKWYVSPEPNSTQLRYLKTNDGTGFTIDGATITLPSLSAPLTPDLNRTGVEVMRVSAVFSDREEDRTGLNGANVLKASYSWLLGNRDDTVNRIDLKYRDAPQDYRLVELRLRDDDNIAKVGKVLNKEFNGQAIDNADQAYRIAAGLLAEKQDADFFYKWKSARDPDGSQVALLLQEGDVVAVTDDGAGVYNIPVIIEEIDFAIDTASLPIPEFTARTYSSRLYDDSITETTIPIVSEAAV